jgi:hypothetical protein
VAPVHDVNEGALGARRALRARAMGIDVESSSLSL